MDFVVKLPKSKNPTTQKVYDSIMVIINKLMKYVFIIPFKKKYKTNQFKFILLNKLIIKIGIPTFITSDKNKFFTSNYWKILMSTIGTKLKMSTIYHPKTNGQIKKISQWKHILNIT